MTHTGCTLQLDGLKLIGHDFSKSVIIYRGGPVSLENVHFHDCLWNVAIPSEGAPAKEGKTLLTQLLKSKNIEDIGIP
jgi:hypothetical protein